ncbi:hypothetical protein [Crateriforma conspicua]|uniref:hypothetical protein n=1 Tax=Crateriforma conspicua TaxID=2527996 RepID=UPI00119E92DA|nr:hypothetical protein [Crateriforma conspicua]
MSETVTSGDKERTDFNRVFHSGLIHVSAWNNGVWLDDSGKINIIRVRIPMTTVNKNINPWNQSSGGTPLMPTAVFILRVPSSVMSGTKSWPDGFTLLRTWPVQSVHPCIGPV